MPSPLYLRAPDAKPQGFVQRPPLAIQIREVTAGDAGVLAALHGECFDDPWTAGDFIRLVTMPGASALLAMEVGEPVGFVLLRRAADEAEIITIATRPFAQRRGVAGTLMKDLSQRLAAQGCRALFIEVAASNMAARALYGSLGFTAAGLRKDYYARPAGRREDALVMRRDL